MWDPYAEFQLATMPNGLTVHAAQWPGRPWEAMGFLIHSGSEYDPVGLEGTAHFVEHMVTENANATKKKINAFFDACGGKVDLGSIDYAGTYYNFFVPIDKAIFKKALSMFGRMLLSAKLTKYFRRERRIIFDEFLHRYPVKFQFDLDMREHLMLYSNYWLGRSVRSLGHLDSVKRIVQSDLQSYYDKHYTPANMSIVGVGGMALSEIVEFLSKSPFAMEKEGVRTPLPNPASDVAPPLETRHVFDLSEHISSVKMGKYRTVAKIPGNVNSYVVQILCQMLYEVLREEVREKRGWAYVIDSSHINYRHFHEFSIDCGPLVLKALNGMDEVIEACIASIGDREDLFERVKGCFLASIFMVDPTGRSVRDAALSDLVFHQRLISLTECEENIKRITMSDIRGLLQWLKPERRWTLIMHP